jgi:type VI secretion system protein VasJ
MDLLSLGKTPIHPENPTGSDIRYDPDFEALQIEIDKLSSPSSTDGIDWKKVSDSAARILSEKSKDLMVASYLAVSQIHLNQIDGFSVGTAVMRDLLENYWESLYPPKKRMRGRIGAINFWAEKTEALLGSMTAKSDKETIASINESLTALEAILSEHLPDPPALHAIRRHINSFLSQTPEDTTPEPKAGTGAASEVTAVNAVAQEKMAKPKASPEPGPSLRARSASEPPAQTSETSESEQDPVKSANAGLQAIRNAGLALFEKDGRNADAFRYRRIAAWAKVSEPPPQNGGKTQIPPPSAQETTALNDLKSSGNWHVLLQTTEQKLSRFIYWFDLCRLSAEALTRLGPDYQKAHKAVCDETAFFLYRVSGIDSLAFSDGTPFADSETRQWLKNISLAAVPAGAGEISLGGADAETGQSDQMAEVLKNATSLAGQQKIKEAVGLIHDQLQGSASEKQALTWRMALCQILLGSEFKHLAVPHLEQIISDVDVYRLEKWEPAIALKGLKVAWTGFSSLTDDRYNDMANELLNRISHLDPAEALRLCR